MTIMTKQTENKKASGFKKTEQSAVAAADRKAKVAAGRQRTAQGIEIFRIFDAQSPDKQDRNFVRNLVIKMRQREQTPADLLELYNAEFPKSREVNFMKFYYFYKQFAVSKDDFFVYQTYRDFIAQYTSEPVSLRAFCELGEYILDRLDEWATHRSANSQKAILVYYFETVLPVARKLNESFLTNPEALLREYGWAIFEKQVEKNGGKWGFLQLDDAILVAAEKENDKLVQFERIRKSMVALGDVPMYDEMAFYRAEHGIDAAYAFYSIENKV